MKRLILFLIAVAFAMASTAASAAERGPLGKGNFALKLDYIAFTDSHFDRGGNENDGLYVGLEGYGEISPSLYLGGEIGAATNVEVAGEEINFYPLELNLKYALKTVPNLVFDFGGGISYSYVELQYTPPFGRPQQERDDWLFGAQFFIDLTYKINWFSIGFNAKYQITEDFGGGDVDLNNFRVGVQFGIMF